MATNYDLKLVVDADTTEAQRKLKELADAQSSPEVQAAAQRVREFVAPTPERAQPAPRPQPPAATTGEGRAPARPQQQPQPPAPTPSREGRAPSRPQPPPPAPQPARKEPRPQPQPPARQDPRPKPQTATPQPARPDSRPQPPVQPPVIQPPTPNAVPQAPALPVIQPPTPNAVPQAPAQPPVTQTPAQPPVPQPPQPQPATPQVHSPAAQDAADRVRKFRLDPNYKPNLSNNPDEFGKKAGDVAGRAIGKAVAGFIAHEVSTTIFNGLKTVGGDNREINQAEAGVSGALTYGTMGAMLGGPIGALIGAGAGAIMGVYQERQRQEKAMEARDVAISDADYRRRVNTEVGMTDSAFMKSLELAGGTRRRAEMIRSRRDEIANGDGGWSIKSLERALKGTDPESSEGKSILANLEMQKNRVAQLDSQLVDEGLAVAPGRLDPGSVADSWAKRGVQVGAQVDVAQVNEKIMGEVQNCRALLEKIANMGTDNLKTVERIKAAVYE